MVAKSDEFRHTFFNTPNLPFSDQNLNFTGRKMYANGRYWEAKVRGAGGVARSKGKEHLFWGSDSGILSSANVGFLSRSLNPSLFSPDRATL
jgi:hypothetical protein